MKKKRTISRIILHIILIIGACIMIPALPVDDPDVTEDGQRVHIHEPVYLFPGNSAVGELS